MKGLWITIALLAASPAIADTLLISWEAPTARTDGTLLSPQEIGGFELWVDDVLAQSLPSDQTQVEVEALPGERCVKMLTQDTEGRRGPFSPIVCKEAKASPGQMIITIELTFETVLP